MVTTNQKSVNMTEDTIERAKATVERADLATTNVSTKALSPDMVGEPYSTTLKETVVAPTIASERALLQLPGDFLKTPTTPYQPKHCTLTLSKDLVKALQVQAQQEQIDERSLLLAAFNALLYRYTQQETIDLELTLPTETTSGTCTTAIRTQIHSGLTVHALVSQISTALHAAQEASNLPSLPAQPDQPSNNRVSLPIAITFVEEFFRVEGKQQLLSELQPQASVESNRHDLHLIIFQQKGRLAGVLQYNASLFQAETIQRLAGHLQMLLQGIVDDRDSAIMQLPLMTQAETQQLAGWQSAVVSYPQTPIHQYIEAHAEQQPEAIALTFQDQQLTYAALNQRANQLAHYLAQVGVGADVRVAVCVEPSLELAVSLLGIFKAGGVYLPLDPTHPAERLTTILEETQPKVLLTQSHLLPHLPAIADYILCLDQAEASLHPLPTHNPAIDVRLEQTSHLVYTSGTTGKPKGVMTSHGNLVQYILTAQERFGFDCHDVMPAIARFTFSITMFELLSPLVAGGTLVILEREHILDFKRMVQTLQQSTVIHTSPSLLQKLLAYIQDNDLDFQSFQGLKHVSTGGDMVPIALLETMQRVFSTAEIYVIYGCSEVSCMGCSYPVVSDRPIKSRVGKPFTNVAVRLYDAHQNLVPIGIPGEIYIGGAGVTQGYWQREALTQEKFITIDGSRFYRTGDVGRFDADGNLEMLGRADFQIKLRGIRIELGEIEATLRQAPGVREGIVAACELEEGEKRLVAYVVLDPVQQPPIENIRSLLKEKLPDYMVPAAFVVLDALPVNINQKVDRRALPDPRHIKPQPTETFTAATNQLEQQLTAIWEQVLNVHPIGIKDNFFDLGGHSLLALTVLAQIEQTIGKHLPITTLYHAPTIETLAIATAQEEADAPATCQSLMVIQPGGAKAPLFCIHVLGRGLKFYRPLANHLEPAQPLYGLSVQIVDQEQAPPNRVEALATYYIQEMQRLQPEGPYFLAGVSFGGIVAFEMAQQLHRKGQQVKLLAMLDTNGPNATTAAFIQEKLSAHWSQLWQQGPGYALKKVMDKVHGIYATWQEQLDDSFKTLACQYHLRRQRSLPNALHDFMFEKEHQQASQRYTPEPYAGKIILFRAIDHELRVGESVDPYLGWGTLATEGIEIFDVPGNHLSMLGEPNVRVIAEHLQPKLRTNAG